MIGLTAKQAEALRFITDYLDRSGGIAPSFDEMKQALGLASKNGVWRLMDALEEKGHIVRLKHRARALQVVTPETPKPAEVVCEAIMRRAAEAGLISPSAPRTAEILRRCVMEALA